MRNVCFTKHEIEDVDLETIFHWILRCSKEDDIDVHVVVFYASYVSYAYGRVQW